MFRFTLVFSYRYFLVFSWWFFFRMSSAYLLKDKTQVLYVIKKTKWNKSPIFYLHVLRKDITFIKAKVSNFVHLMVLYIKLLALTPYKKWSYWKHLLDMDRILTMQMHIPKYLHFNLIFVACHIINMIPSSMLHGGISYPNKLSLWPFMTLDAPILFRICDLVSISCSLGYYMRICWLF